MLGLASNLYWGLWGVLQAKYSTLDFDYLGYSARRLTRFRSESRQVYAEVTTATGDTNGDGAIGIKEMGTLAQEIMENVDIKGPGVDESGMATKLDGMMTASVEGLNDARAEDSRHHEL